MTLLVEDSSITDRPLKALTSMPATGENWAIVDPRSEPGWDSAVESDPVSHVFLSSAWASVIADTYGYTPFYFIRRSTGQIRSILPLMEVDSVLTGRRGVSLPFTDTCPPRISDPAEYKSLFEQVIELGRKRRWRYVELRGALRPDKTAEPSLTYIEHRIPLLPEKEAVKLLRSEVRTAIRRAERANVRVEVADSSEAMREYYRLHCQTRRKHGVPPQPFEFFLNVWRRLVQKGLGSIFLARHEGRAVAGAVFLKFGSRVLFKFGASDERYQQLRGNNLIFWEAIKHFQRANCAELNLGRTNPEEEGLRRFKCGWGAVEYPLHYYRYDLSTNKFVTISDAANGWTTSVFARLPISLNRWVGRLAYRHMG